ncbi:Protein FAM89A [Myotis brandtii]|uniref:Protein FAM89A n=1 Tax=Myotis brandtii TaxID=109478 RepID=S7P1W3_MYOBR|nr:Protein FAM89A [Myotis brandtii]
MVRAQGRQTLWEQGKMMGSRNREPHTGHFSSPERRAEEFPDGTYALENGFFEEEEEFFQEPSLLLDGRQRGPPRDPRDPALPKGPLSGSDWILESI